MPPRNRNAASAKKPRASRRQTGASSPAPETEKYSYEHASQANNPTLETAIWADLNRTPPTTNQTPDAANEAADTPPEDHRRPRLHWPGRKYDPTPPRHHPLYTHDKISPREIIGNLMRPDPQPRLIGADFNRLPKNHEMEPYQHQGAWHNRLIRADSASAMQSLLNRENMRGQVNLIYYDPPYNKSFQSNFAPAADHPSVDRDSPASVPNDPAVIKAFRDAYRDGVNSYLAGILENLKLARELLAEDGSMIVQIGPDNLHSVAALMNEVFGTENHIATIPYRTGNTQGNFLSGKIGNWLLWFAKNREHAKKKYRQLYRKELLQHYAGWSHSGVIDRNGSKRPMTTEEKRNPQSIPTGWTIYHGLGLNSAHTSYTGRSDVYYHHPDGKPCPNHGWSDQDQEQAKQATSHPDHICKRRAADPPCDTPLPDNWNDHECNPDCHKVTGTRKCPYGRKCGPNCTAQTATPGLTLQWSVSLKGIHTMATDNRVYFESSAIRWLTTRTEHPGRKIGEIWEEAGRVSDKQYVVETPPRVLERCILMNTDPGDLVLDLTCGSGAMPVAAETWGRRWVACDVSAVSIAIARERLITNTYPYHMLVDSPKGHQKDHHLEQDLLPVNEPRQPFAAKPRYTYNPAGGFVNERQMRVSADTLAYGPNPDGSDIIRHPDRTLKEPNKVRVASDFEVCSDNPYRSMSPTAAMSPSQNADPQVDTPAVLQEYGFQVNQAIAERVATNLKLSGISQNGNARYRVRDLQPALHRDLTHTGTLVQESDQARQENVAFYIGQADETVSRSRVDRAVQAAAWNSSSLLVVVGFDKNPDAIPTAEYPSMNMLYVSAPRDLQLEHLKDEARDNAFVIISEPEVRLLPTEDPEIVQLETLGIDAYDPATGQVTNGGSRQVMAVMVDIAYDEKRFLAHRYNVIPNGRNRRTIKRIKATFGRNLDEAAWQQMQTLTTLPFHLPPTEAEADEAERNGQDRPATAIAVKVIDQTGMEHMTVITNPRDPQWW